MAHLLMLYPYDIVSDSNMNQYTINNDKLTHCWKYW